jgi:chromate reductase
MTVNILGIPGSLRRNSLNRSLLRAAAEIAPDGVNIEVADLGDIPLYNWDLEQEQGFPESVERFRRQVADADALLIATPEYNNSVPGALKNAIDWATRGGADAPINEKPAAIMGAAGRLGSVRAQMHLRVVLLHNDLKVVQKPEVLVPAQDGFTEGVLTNERYRDQIRRLLDSLLDIVEKERVPVAAGSS